MTGRHVLKLAGLTLGVALCGTPPSSVSGSSLSRCPGPGNVIVIDATCAQARVVARAYPRACANRRYCDAAGFGTCRHLASRRIECVGGTSSDSVRPIAPIHNSADPSRLRWQCA